MNSLYRYVQFTPEKKKAYNKRHYAMRKDYFKERNERIKAERIALNRN